MGPCRDVSRAARSLAIDAVRGQVFHVAVEQAGTLAVQHSISIANYSAHSRARATNCALAYASRFWAQVGIAFADWPVRLDLIRKWELIYGDLVLIRVPRPGAVEATVGFILLIFFQNCQCASVQLRICTIRIQCGHTANGKRATTMADRDQQIAQVLEECDVVRDRVAVGKYPLRIVEIEVDQRGHVIPTPEV